MSFPTSTKSPDWRAVDPQAIAAHCSQRHIQSVLEDAQRDILAAEATIADLVAVLRAIHHQHNEETMAAALLAIWRAEGRS